MRQCDKEAHRIDWAHREKRDFWHFFVAFPNSNLCLRVHWDGPISSGFLGILHFISTSLSKWWPAINRAVLMLSNSRKKNLESRVCQLNKGVQCTRKRSLPYNLFLARDLGLRALISDSISRTTFTFSLSMFSMIFLNPQLPFLISSTFYM